MTSPGTYRTRPGYGAGVPDYVKGRKTKSSRDELTARVREQVSQERRVEKVLEVLLEDLTLPGSQGLKVTVRVQAFGRSIRPLVYNFSKEA